MKQDAAARNRAKRLRARKRAGEKLSKADEAWLKSYVEETSRFRARATGNDAPEPDAADAAPASSSAEVPTHKVAPVADGGPERFVAQAVVTPAASAPPAGNAPEPVAGTPAADAAGATPLSGAPDEPPPGPTPIVGAPQPKQMDPALLEAGAQRFAALVVAFNTLGIKALLELFPEGTLPLPTGIDGVLRSKEAQGQFLDFLAMNARALVYQHPWLALVGPSPAVVVLGCSSVSMTAAWVRWVKPMLAGEPTVVEVGPGAQQAAPPGPPNGARRPPPPPPRGSQPVEAGVIDFGDVLPS